MKTRRLANYEVSRHDPIGFSTSSCTVKMGPLSLSLLSVLCSVLHLFNLIGLRLIMEARRSAKDVVEVAKDAKENVADVAEKVGSAVKSRWAVQQQPSTRQAMQEHLISAAATASMFLRKGISETKDKMTVGKTRVEEAAKKNAEKSKNLLTDLER